MNTRFFKETSLGLIGIEENGTAVIRLYLPGDKPENDDTAEKETPLLKEAFHQLQEYCGHKRKNFTLPLAPEGTAFMQKVWDELRRIPYGTSVSYKCIAERIGRPKAARAIGQANHRNPIAIFIPCHRVIGADGSLGGYGGGLEMKQRLLDLEQNHAGTPIR